MTDVHGSGHGQSSHPAVTLRLTAGQRCWGDPALLILYIKWAAFYFFIYIKMGSIIYLYIYISLNPGKKKILNMRVEKALR